MASTIHGDPSRDRLPRLRQVVLDATDARALAEFYRRLLGFTYRTGDAPPPSGVDDVRGRDWLVLVDPTGSLRLAFQHVDALPPSTWPDANTPQQLHLDLTVADAESLAVQHARALELGARLLLDRSEDPHEMLYVYADPEGHPFCIFVASVDP
jgi:catechol 2,3-dioxygenase-like lactoylglutathione lyase family enzyme